MHKIKKGIKKKIKGKKEKDDELFTPEELEKYKKRKEEEARRLAEQQQQEEVPEEPEQHQQEPQPEQHTTGSEVDPPTEEGATADTSETKGSSSSDNDWKNFFAATDTVLKQTTDNLVHIKEDSFFQKKEEKPAVPTNTAAPPTAGPPSAASSGKKWVDLEKGGLDDDEEEVDGEKNQETEQKEQEPEPEPEPEPELELHCIEDLPEVDFDDFTEVFDTTYVDNVESGQVKLHYIPDSPTTEDPNEPDPFDTSVVDKVLHTEKPKQKVEEAAKPTKKKKQLVSLGCAVEVLSGNVQNVDKSTAVSASSKRRRVIPKEVNLLADFGEKEESKVETEEAEEEDKNLLDDILCVGDLDAELPEAGAFLSPSPRATSPAVPSEETEKQKDESDIIVSNGLETGNKEVDLSEFLESSPDQDSKDSKPENGKDLDLKDLVAEFDIIDKAEVTNESLVAPESDPIEDEFDAEFAFLAAESVAKSKEKEAEDLEDDPFDTSVAAQILGPEDNTEAEKDPFDVGFAEEALGEEAQLKVKPGRPPVPRSASHKTEAADPFDTSVADTVSVVDPFDTSVAEKHLPVDPFALEEPEVSLPETLQPQQGKSLSKSDSFDPFDTSIAESFGRTELKVLETELLTAAELDTKGSLSKSESDFDFNPRSEEPEKEAAANTCLLTNTDENTTSDPVLAPSQDTQADDFDPFDTSIAAKVEIQTLEAELLSQPDQIQQIGKQEPSDSKKAPPKRPPPAQTHLLAASPTDSNPALQPSLTSDLTQGDQFDPFDTSIAEQFGNTELKSIENRLLASETEKPNVSTAVPEKAKSLHLPVKPLRPPSPKCLLATTPLDDQPTLQPVLEPTADLSENPSDDFDPFDTSIAEQFGKTELKVLESELLTTTCSQKLEEDIEFNPRESTEAPPPRPPRPSRPSSPAPPACLLTASPARSPTDGELLAPTGTKVLQPEEDIDPFDTSIADKFGRTELRQLESELLVSDGNSIVKELDGDDFNPRKETEYPSGVPKSPKPDRPRPPPSCLLAVTPTDTSAPLQPSLNQIQGPLEATTAEEVDPFDTSIADKLGKTEIKALEETLLTEGSKTASSDTLQVTSVSASSGGSTITPDSFFSSSPTPELGPTLQPVQEQNQVEAEELDPFDTSIADTFGKTELKTLETELLADSGTKRNLSDDEFDPREEENKIPKRPPAPKSAATPVNLLDSGDDHNIVDQPLQALQAQSAADKLDNYDPFDTSIAADIVPSKFELKQIESELLASEQDPFDTSKIN